MRTVLAVFAVALFLSVGLHAATYHVPGDFDNIQDAVVFAVDYDSVIVGSGEFEVNVTIDKPLTLRGITAGSTILRPGEDSGAVILVNADDVTISHLTVREAYGWDEFGAGLTILNSDNCLVESCNISYSSQVGVGIAGSTNCTIRFCTLSENERAIYLYGTYEPGTDANEYITIEHNKLFYNQFGVEFYHYYPRHNHATISSNYIAGCNVGIMTITNDSCDIAYNQFYYNYGHAIVATSCMCGVNDNEAHHNVFIDNNAGGVQCYDQSGGTTVWYDIATSEGNFWNDYVGEDLDENGIGDTPYAIDFEYPSMEAFDSYPLMTFPDVDADGVFDGVDNCPEVSNENQSDLDFDGLGNECDFCTDYDGDGYGTGVLDTCLPDICGAIYNPDQEDFDGDGVGDSCDYQFAQHATISGGCVGLVVGNNGNVGDRGGAANLDFYTFGDECDIGATVYLFEGGPVIARVSPGDTVFTEAFYDDEYVHVLDGLDAPEIEVLGDITVARSGPMASWDMELGLTREWYAFSGSHDDHCNVIVQHTRYYTLGNEILSGLSLSDGLDWDIPSDEHAENHAGVISSGDFEFVYLQGDEFDGSGCIGNDTRFGASVMLGMYLNDQCDAVRLVRQQPSSQYALRNDEYVWPDRSYIASEILPLMDQGQIAGHEDTADYNVLTTYVHDYTLFPGDTLSVWVALVSVRDGESGDLLAAVEAADATWKSHILDLSECGCCVGMKGDIDLVADCTPGEQTVDIGDLSNLINHLFLTFEPICCVEEADINPAVAPDGVVDIADLTEMIGYLFIYFQPLPYCQ